ncbi:hypothetical protein [Intrasporangium flavum]|uniref:hypothetical protein n=1 Tax=Intrasporangium flavum TaxID=1428657 RepID=UPI00096FCD7E|nr:hypothetical protein [Intrasporangium flavum]
MRAEGVELIGEMAGSGYRVPPALARRADGQTFQLTPLLYLVLTTVDGRRSFDEVAEHVSAVQGRTVTGDNVRTLVDEQLRPLGLLAREDGSQPELKKSNPLLALRFKYAVTDPERTRRWTAPFARLFHPVLVALVVAVFLAVSWWVLFHEGLASATYQAFDQPGLLLVVVLVTVLSAGFHEFGHAAAARRGGATPGVMGAGIYLVWPAFYTDVTDSYRLGRGGRVRTDLGGLYFNAMVAVATAGVWWLTRWDALLLVVATQILQMVRQLTPLVRFDGYHVLADVTGVPDLFHRIRPTLLGVLPWRWKDPESRVLKPWARVVVTLWVLVVVPVLMFSIFTMVIALPRVLGTAWRSLGAQSHALTDAWAHTDVLAIGARCVAILAVVFPILATAVLLVRLVRGLVTAALRRTRGAPVKRGATGVVALALVAGLVLAWWPREGSYRPVQPYEGGTLVQAAGAIPAPAALRRSPAGLTQGASGTVLAGWGKSDPRPTREKPQLAVVLVPRGVDSGSAANPEPTPSAAGWVFPFDKPLAPGPGDNQALAVNTTDGTIQYDVAFALVWIDDDSPALNTNEAYAFSSCDNCAAVAIGFQIVLVTGDNHVAVPQNLSGAVNVDCVNCLSYALASQLFLTLDGPLSDEGKQQIAAVWKEIAAFGAHITEVPLSEISDRLEVYKQQIVQIIEKEQGPLVPGESTSVDGGTSSTPSTSPTPVATDPSSVSPAPAPDPTGAGTGDEPTPSTPAPTTSEGTDGTGSDEPASTPSADGAVATPENGATTTSP